METLDTQVMRLENSLLEEDGGRDWSLDIQAAPECVGILAECLLIASKSDVMALELKGPGLEYDYLFANIRHCEQMGKNVLRDTDEDMKRVAVLANELGRDGGLIESMLRYCQPDQSAARDRQLGRYLTRGQAKVKESVDKIKGIREKFRAWEELTARILRALDSKSSANEDLEREKMKQLEAKETKIKLNAEENTEEKRNMEKNREQLQYARNFKWWYERNLAVITSGVGVAEGVAGIAAAPLLGVGVVFGVAGAWIHYNILNGEIEKGEQAENARLAEIRRLEEEAAELSDALKELARERSSISRIKDIVFKSIYRLHKLQQHIDKFMTFLITLQRIINRTVEMSDEVFDIAQDKEGLVDPGIKRDMLAGAFDMKTRFRYVAMVSAVYSDVSSTFVLPEIDRLTELDLGDERTDAQIEEKVAKLGEMRKRVGQGTAELLASRRAALRGSLQELVRTSAVSFRNVSHELLSKT